MIFTLSEERQKQYDTLTTMQQGQLIGGLLTMGFLHRDQGSPPCGVRNVDGVIYIGYDAGNVPGDYIVWLERGKHDAV